MDLKKPTRVGFYETTNQKIPPCVDNSVDYCYLVSFSLIYTEHYVPQAAIIAGNGLHP